MEVTGKYLASLIRIRNNPGSNLGLRVRAFGFPQSLHENSEIVSRLDHDRFLQYFFFNRLLINRLIAGWNVILASQSIVKGPRKYKFNEILPPKFYFVWTTRQIVFLKRRGKKQPVNVWGGGIINMWSMEIGRKINFPPRFLEPGIFLITE